MLTTVYDKGEPHAQLHANLVRVRVRVRTTVRARVRARVRVRVRVTQQHAKVSQLHANYTHANHTGEPG